MYERVDKCPVCSAENFENKLICKDHTVSGESFAVVECAECTHRFTNPRPSGNDIDQFYKSEDYISHSDTNKGLINQLYKIVRLYTISRKLRLLERLVKHSSPTILDIGSGTGHFLSAAANKGWHTYGIEPSPEAAQKSQEKGLKISSGLDKLPQNVSFDAITMWHVLEHVYDLHGDLKKIKNLLKPSGYLIIAVPNHLSADAEIYGSNWAAYDVPRHIQHFNQHSIKKLMRLRKLSFHEQLPMKFDAFYISLLSERYHTGKEDKITAFKAAWKSNAEAANSGEYSSLIYVFQKK